MHWAPGEADPTLAAIKLWRRWGTQMGLPCGGRQPGAQNIVGAALPSLAGGAQSIGDIGREANRDGNLAGSLLRSAAADGAEHRLLGLGQGAEGNGAGGIGRRQLADFALGISQSFAACHNALPPSYWLCES